MKSYIINNIPFNSLRRLKSYMRINNINSAEIEIITYNLNGSLLYVNYKLIKVKTT